MTILYITIFQIIFAFYPSTVATQHTERCLSTGSQYGFVLLGSVFKSFPSESLHLCYDACIKAPACQSLNYNLAENICEFSLEIKRSQPENFQQRDMFVYAEKYTERGKWKLSEQ